MKLTPGATQFSFGWVAYIERDGKNIKTINDKIFMTEKEAVDYAKSVIDDGLI